MGNVKMKDIAEALNVSTVTVSNALAGRKGVSEEVRTRVVEKAKELLTHSDEKIYSIAEKIGYASTTAFHVAFKKKTGMTPAEYRNQNYR